MKTNTSRGFFALFGSLFLLLLALFLFLVFGQGAGDGADVRQISVIINGPQTRYWDAVKQGMDQAALDYNADINYITLALDYDAQEQEAKLGREISEGAFAVIVVPATEDARMAEMIERAESASKGRVPVVLLESELLGADIAANVYSGNEEMGLALGKRAANVIAAYGGQALVITYASGTEYETRRLAGINAALEAVGSPTLVETIPDDGRNSAESIRELAHRTGATILIGLNARMTESMAAAFAEEEDRPLIYGAESTADIVAYLEKGVITCIAAQNAYILGYLSVRAAASTAPGFNVAEGSIEFAVVTREDIFSPENERLLFPFIQIK